MTTERVYTLQALTDIWTGDATGEPGRLIPTGLLGSIRWWFEVIVRGLGGSACDPTLDGNQCPDSKKNPADPGHHCVVCELFGCTGWARKFRFDVLDENDQPKQTQIKKGETFKLRFTELRPICETEWALLDLTLRLIAEYGAIGAKTVYKPSEELALADASVADFTDDCVLQRNVRGSPLNRNDKLCRIDGQGVESRDEIEIVLASRATGDPVDIVVERNGRPIPLQAWIGKRHHQDYGLIDIKGHPTEKTVTLEQLQRHTGDQRWRCVNQGKFSWASLQDFWCVKGRYLTRQKANQSIFNRVLGRKEDKSEKERRGKKVIRWSDLLEDDRDEMAAWLAGRQQESKKVFSFKDPESARRTFGFVQDPDKLDEMRQRLRDKAWPDLRDDEFLTGEAILGSLLGGGGTA